MPLFLNFGSGFRRLESGTWTASEVKSVVGEDLNCCPDCFYLICNGKLLLPDTQYEASSNTDTIIHALCRVRGGKGGFGSMLRALGAQIEKTTNHEACRDLSGRRMRDVNNEKKIAEFLQKKSDVEQDRKKRKQEKLERILNPPKHVVNDSSYTLEIQNRAEEVDDALRQALQKSKNNSSGFSGETVKRKLPDEGGKAKRSCKWLDVDDDSDSDDDVQTPKVESADVSCIEENCRGQTTLPLTEAGGPIKHHQKEVSKAAPADGDRAIEPPKVEVTRADSTKDIVTTVTIDNARSTTENTNSSDHVKRMDKPPKDLKPEPLDLSMYESTDHLESVGLDRLKSALMALGLKCGGTLQQRAERLFSTKGIAVENLDKALFAKPTKPKKK